MRSVGEELTGGPRDDPMSIFGPADKTETDDDDGTPSYDGFDENEVYRRVFVLSLCFHRFNFTIQFLREFSVISEFTAMKLPIGWPNPHRTSCALPLLYFPGPILSLSYFVAQPITGPLQIYLLT